MSKNALVSADECRIYLASPVSYDECVVLAEHDVGLLFVLTDELRDGRCVVEFPSLEEGRAGWRMSLEQLRAALARAEALLVARA